jgi:TPR repeat protein
MIFYDVINSVVEKMRPIDQRNLKWYEDQAKIGDPSAQFVLGAMYHMGEIVKQSDFRALDLYIKSGDNSLPQSKFMAHFLYNMRYGIPKDLNKAKKLLLEAADSDLGAAQFVCGMAYNTGDLFEKDAHKSFSFYLKAAEKGLSISQYETGLNYYRGRGVEGNYDEAFKWFKRSAKQNFPKAFHAVGVMYYKALAPLTDENKNIFRFVSPFEKLNSERHHRLGSSLPRRRKMHIFLLEAFKFFNLAAEQGVIPSMWALSDMFLYGEGVPIDKEMSEKWRLRAEQAEEKK